MCYKKENLSLKKLIVEFACSKSMSWLTQKWEKGSIMPPHFKGESYV